MNLCVGSGSHQQNCENLNVIMEKWQFSTYQYLADLLVFFFQAILVFSSTYAHMYLDMFLILNL